MTLNSTVIGYEIFFRCLLAFIQLLKRRNFFYTGCGREEWQYRVWQGRVAREDDTRCGYGARNKHNLHNSQQNYVIWTKHGTSREVIIAEK